MNRAERETVILEEPILFMPDQKEHVYARLENNEKLRICSVRDGKWVVDSHPIEKLSLKIDDQKFIEVYCAKYQKYTTDGPLHFKFLVGEEQGENYFKSIIYHEPDHINNQSVNA